MFLLLTLLLPRFAAASPVVAPDRPRPVIVPGREREVMALLRPYGLGDEVAPGWVLRAVAIEVGTITIRVAGPRQGVAQLTLDHPEQAPPAARLLESFALQVVERPPGSELAIERLTAAIERNDDGSFWGPEVVYALEPRDHPHGGQGLLGAWAHDGIVFASLLALALLVLVGHASRGAPRRVRWSLVAVVLLGAGLRLGLSPTVALAPWPYTRVPGLARMIFHGPGLAALHPDPVWLTETILASSLALSILAPLAVYAHARYLLDDHRAGLLAALVIAVLPLHLRFSHSDTAFIPSITIGSTVFALLHAATRERSPVAGWLALVVAAAPLAMLYEVRPLNILYYPLLLATAFLHQGLHTDKASTDRKRVIGAFVIVSAVTFGLGVPRLLEAFGAQIEEGSSIGTLGAGLRVLVHPRLNELLNPVFSPPGLVLLAGLGAAHLWRSGRRSLFAFIVSWLLGLLVAHAYVVPKSMYMQARYHLHLIVPYTLLVVCGADVARRWLARRREQGWPWLAGRRHGAVRTAALAYVLASPLLHRHGITYVALNDVREWTFVHGLRDRIPAGCTVVEPTGPSADPRFARVGSMVERGVPRQRWPTRGVSSPDDVRELVADPPACLYWYEGLPCLGVKATSEPKAPACAAMDRMFELVPIARLRFPSEPYDDNLAAGLGPLQEVELRLHLALPRAPGGT